MQSYLARYLQFPGQLEGMRPHINIYIYIYIENEIIDLADMFCIFLVHPVKDISLK